jgi:hypothetical protein
VFDRIGAGLGTRYLDIEAPFLREAREGGQVTHDLPRSTGLTEVCLQGEGMPGGVRRTQPAASRLTKGPSRAATRRKTVSSGWDGKISIDSSANSGDQNTPPHSEAPARRGQGAARRGAYAFLFRHLGTIGASNRKGG